MRGVHVVVRKLSFGYTYQVHHDCVSNHLLGVPLSPQTQPVETSAIPREDRPSVYPEEDSDKEPVSERVTRGGRVSKPARSSNFVY